MEKNKNKKVNQKKNKNQIVKPIKVEEVIQKDKKTIKREKRELLQSKKGIHKFWTTLILETLYIFVVEMLFKIIFKSFSFDYTVLRIFLSSCILGIIITLITTNLKVVPRRIVLILFNFLVAFYTWLQMGFMDFLGTFISMGSAEQGTKITAYIGDFLLSINWKTYMILIPFILSIIYFVLERRITKDGFLKKYNFKNVTNDVIVVASLLILAGCFYATISVKFMQNKYQTISNKSLFKYPSNPSIAIKNYGTSVYFLLDLKGTIKGGVEEVYATNTSRGKDIVKQEDLKREIDDTVWESIIENEEDSSYSTLHNYFINRDITDKNEYTGKFKGKNLIVVMLESVSFTVFGDEYKEYYPTLYKLQNEGISAVNNFSAKNNCATGESEMTSEISLYSIETTCTVNTYRKNVYPEALMSMMRNNGYYTSAYHDYTDQYYYRSTFEYNFGNNRYYGVEDLGMEYNPIYKEWPSDVTFMKQALPKFIKEDKFASFMITVTSHSPYMYSSEFGDKYLSMFEDLDIPQNAKRYLSKVKEVDKALEYLLDTLDEEGKLEDTVIVLFGDHYPYALSDKEFASIATYDIEEAQNIDRTPFIIYNKGTEAEKIRKYTSPLDIAPTVLNLFGINYDPRYYLGHDVFSHYNDYVVFPDNSWQNGYGFYSASKGEFFVDKDANRELTDEEIIENNNEINDMRNMSGLAIKKDYFNYLFDTFKSEKKKLKEKESSTKTSDENKKQEENKESEED